MVNTLYMDSAVKYLIFHFTDCIRILHDFVTSKTSSVTSVNYCFNTIANNAPFEKIDFIGLINDNWI